MKMRRKSLILISVMLVLSLMLTACGGAKDDGGENDKPADKVASEAPDKLVIATASDAITMDPVANNDAFSGNIMAQVYDGLVKIDMEGNIIPNLAKSYEPSEDGLTYTFHLEHLRELLKLQQLLIYLEI